MTSNNLRVWKFLRTALFLCVVIYDFHAAAMEVREDADKNIHRIRRSPQLFSGKSLVPDLSQIRPISLNDLNEFRLKMASLANLTTLLEQAVEAEKTARNGLQTFVNTIKQQIVGVRQAVNPDPENFWMESTECGGVMVSQTGKISYKSNDLYKNHERCIWTVRANYRSKIKIAFNNGGLEKHNDYVAVTELIQKSDSFETEWVTKRIQPGQTNIFDGPVIFISFVSDGSNRGQGFQLEYEGMGTNTNTNTIYQHFHLTNWTGQFDSANLSEHFEQNNVTLDDGVTIKVTAVINPTFWNASKLQVSVPENRLDLRPDECTTTNLAILNDFVIKPHGTSSSCCAGTCEISNFETTNRMMIGIFSSSDISDGSQFEINWSTDTNVAETVSIDTCGNTLVGDFGKIRYKLATPYDNNERCLWAIQPETAGAAEAKLQLLKEGFEFQYDFLTVSSISPNDNGSLSVQTKYLYKAGDPLRITSSLMFVEFYSDSATFGTPEGFELIWEFIHTVDDPLSTETHYTIEESGSIQPSCSTNSNNKLNLNILNPHYLDESPIIMSTDDTTSQSDKISNFGSTRGTFTRLEKSTDGFYQSDDGIIILIMDCRLINTDLKASVNWRKGDKPRTGENSGDITFIKSVDECGELLIGDAGRISYKLGKEYELNERCTWVIKAKSKPTITVQLMADGFESCCDGIQIYSVNGSGTIAAEGTAISREHRFHTFEGPILFIMFYSDHSVKGTGFTVEFQTKGDNIVDEALIVKHSLVPVTKVPTTEEPFGPHVIQGTENTLSISAFVLPQIGEITPNSTLTVGMENINVNECNQDSVTLLEIFLKSEYNLLKRYPNEQLCPLESMPGLSTVVGTFDSEKFPVNGVLIVVMKIKEGGENNKSLSITLG